MRVFFGGFGCPNLVHFTPPPSQCLPHPTLLIATTAPKVRQEDPLHTWPGSCPSAEGGHLWGLSYTSTCWHVESLNLAVGRPSEGCWLSLMPGLSTMSQAQGWTLAVMGHCRAAHVLWDNIILTGSGVRVAAKSISFGVPALPSPGRVTWPWSSSFNISVGFFSHDTSLIGLFWGSSQIIDVEPLKHCLALL